MSQRAILYIAFFGVKKCDIGHENTSFLVVIHLISVGCLGPTLYGGYALRGQSAALFFKLISKRYEKASTIITSNKPFEEWGEVFNDEVVAAAILDRILHHCHPFLIQGKSYRLREIMGKKKD